MRLTVLGSCRVVRRARGRRARRTSSRAATTRVLLDCGNGSARQPREGDGPARARRRLRHAPPPRPLRSTCSRCRRRSATRPTVPRPSARSRCTRRAGLLDSMACLLDERGQRGLATPRSPTRGIERGASVAVGDLEVTPVPVEHIPDTFALRVAVRRARCCATLPTRASATAVLARRRGCATCCCAEATLPARVRRARAAHDGRGGGPARRRRRARDGSCSRTCGRRRTATELLDGARRTFAGEVTARDRDADRRDRVTDARAPSGASR